MQVDLVDYARQRGLHPIRAIYAALWEGMSLHFRGTESDPPRKRIPPIAAERLAAFNPRLIFMTRE